MFSARAVVLVAVGPVPLRLLEVDDGLAVPVRPLRQGGDGHHERPAELGQAVLDPCILVHMALDEAVALELAQCLGEDLAGDAADEPDEFAVPAASVVPRPAGLDATAALWVAYSTAYGALVEKAATRPGDHVLITAASSAVGLAAIQVARQLGAVPLAVTRSGAKKDALLAAGAEAVIATDRDDVSEAAHRHTGGAGADIILDTVMGPGLADLSKAAKPGGTLVTAGWLDPRPASFPMNWPLTIIGYASFEHTLDPTVVRRIAAFLEAGLRTGALRPTVDRVFGLDDIVAAHAYLEEGRQVGKIVVTV